MNKNQLKELKNLLTALTVTGAMVATPSLAEKQEMFEKVHTPLILLPMPKSNKKHNEKKVELTKGIEFDGSNVSSKYNEDGKLVYIIDDKEIVVGKEYDINNLFEVEIEDKQEEVTTYKYNNRK